MQKATLKHKRLFKFTAIMALTVTVLVLALTYFRNNTVPVIMNTCEAQARAIGINAINNAASTVITEDLKYEDLFDISYNDDGSVALIQAKSPKINRLAREMARLTQSFLESVGEEEVSLALGTLTGITVLIGMGPPVNIKITPIGVANCDFVSEFTSAGINQTVHKIYVDIFVDIEVALPIDELNVRVKSDILVCENLIVGKVPDTYVSLGRVTEGLNLIP